MDKQNERKFQRKNRWADVLAAIILLAVLVISIFTVRDYVKSKMLNFYSAHEGSIAVTLPGKILVLRHEYLLTAPASGDFVPVAKEGERVKEGAVIGYCGGVELAALKGGAVSYLLDGWEQKLTINSINDMDWPQAFSLLKEEYTAVAAAMSADELPELNSAANRPVARLVDNLLDYKVILKLSDPRELLAEEKTITFSLPEGKIFTNSFSERWQTPEGDIYYIFDISSKEDIFFSLRYSEAEVIAKELHGIIIPSSAVTLDVEGKVGVFIQKKRKLVFVEITELTSKEGFSVVSGLERTAAVVTNPAKATDGQKIY